MAAIFFRGRIDLDKLSMSEISEITAAVAVLQKSAEKEGFNFESGPSRKSVPRPDMQGKRSKERPLQQRRLLVVLASRSGPMSYSEIEEATGMRPGTINPHLSALNKEGLLVKTRILTGKRGPGRLSDTSYELNEGGKRVAQEVIDAGTTLLT